MLSGGDNGERASVSGTDDLDVFQARYPLDLVAVPLVPKPKLTVLWISTSRQSPRRPAPNKAWRKALKQTRKGGKEKREAHSGTGTVAAHLIPATGKHASRSVQQQRMFRATLDLQYPPALRPAHERKVAARACWCASKLPYTRR
jgi:hypothetical protein